ncbi:MAG: hypothetical protein R3D67_07705 [Hyphomicrobiaceae bacterium]
MGQVIAYSFVVTNSGTVTVLSPVTVSDSKIATVTCPALPAGGLIPAASLTCTGSYTITQADLDAGKVDNTATAKSGTTTSPPVTHTLTGTQNPAIATTKAMTTSAATDNGDGTFTATFNAVVRNTGNVSLTGVQLSDDYASGLPSGARIVSASVQAVTSTKRGPLGTGNGAYSGNAASPLLLAAGGETLVPDEAITVTFAIVFDPGTNSSGAAFNNTVVGTGKGPVGTTPVTVPGTTGVPFDAKPKINLVKAVVGSLTSLGGGKYRVTYDLKVKNIGNVAVTLDRINDDLVQAFEQGAARVTAIVSPSIVAAPATFGGTANAAFDGGALASGDKNLIGAAGLLKRDEILTLRFGVEFAANSDPGPFLNSATAYGSSGSTTVSDVSQSSSNPDDVGSQPTPISIDPSGIVYDSTTGAAISGAVVELTTASGQTLPASCLAAGQQPQTTGSTGAYRFDVQLGADPACPASEADYLIKVTPPATYSFRSVIIPTQGGTYDATGCPLPASLATPFCQIVTNATPSISNGSATTYFLALRLQPGDPDISHNHIPLDPGAVSGDIVVTKRATVRTASVGDMVDYVISVRNNTSLPVSGLSLVDTMPPGFNYVRGSARLVASVPGPSVLTVDPVQTGSRLRWRIDGTNKAPFDRCLQAVNCCSG